MDAKLLVVLIFVVVNFLIIFAIRVRTTTVISLIIAHLIMVLFLSFSISNYNSFKEVVLALIAYSMVLLFLISNQNQIFLHDLEKSQPKASKNYRIFILPVFAVVVVVFLALFSVAKDVGKISKTIVEKKLERQNEIMLNPMILPSHPVHIAVRKFYLGKKIGDENDWVDKVQIQSEVSERKQARLRDKLSDNFLLKRSSDVILIIVAISTSLLLLSTRKT